jgi:hypothetical protein
MMSEPSYWPVPDGQAPAGPGDRRASPALLLLAFVAIVIGSALVGLVGGVLWAALAPRAVFVAVGHGQAYVVNAETTAFIAGDAWFCLIGAVGGLVIGLLGYLFAIRRYGPVPMAAVLVGSVVAGLTARWLGQHWGLTGFNDQLATARRGTLLHATLVLGDVPQPLWPAIMLWPLMACLLAGGLVLLSAMRAPRAPLP